VRRDGEKVLNGEPKREAEEDPLRASEQEKESLTTSSSSNFSSSRIHPMFVSLSWLLIFGSTPVSITSLIEYFIILKKNIVLLYVMSPSQN
jgi:accessory colonization factor AcfC